MFQSPPNVAKTIQMTFEGQTYQVAPGQTVAAALMGEGHLMLRKSVVSGETRAAFCMMGICFDCLLEIDGQPNQQSCMIQVREGMNIQRQLKKGECA